MPQNGIMSLMAPPEFQEGNFETYKKEIEIWKLMKAYTPEEQGPIVFRSLYGRAKTAALELTVDQVGSKDGLKLILDKLGKIYLPEENLRICVVLEKFETFKRRPNMNMADFILDFEHLYSQVKEKGIQYPDGVLAYRVMKASNISNFHEQLLRSTVATGSWSYQSVLDQLKKIFNDISIVQSGSCSPKVDMPIKVEEALYTKNIQPYSQDCLYNDFTENEEYVRYNDGEDYDENENYNNICDQEEHDVYYAPSKGSNQNWRPNPQRNFQGRNTNYKSSGNTYFHNTQRYQRTNGNSPNYRSQNYSKKLNPYKMNPKDYRGNPTVCRKCRSTYHWWEDCPHVSPDEKMNSSKRVFYNKNAPQEDLYIALFQKSSPTTSDEIVCLLGETINKAVIDSGCTKTCCGEEWYKAYLETLTEEEVNKIESKESEAVFRFGDSKPVTALKKVLLPIKINNVDLLLETEVVSSNVPLLLSKDTMKRARAKMCFEEDKIELFGEEQSMICTSSGHYAIPIVKNDLEIKSHSTQNSSLVLLANIENKDKKAIARKLHTQFSHPTPQRLIKLIENSGVEDKELKNEIQNVSNNCDICKRYKRSSPKPIVTFPLASQFNETIAMDLKTFKKDQVYFIHFIDHATRFSTASVIKSKRRDTIINAFFQCWISIFGPPEKVLSDNGGEFVNEDFVDLCHNLNINFMTTSAEAPWSNGLVERHNGIIGEVVSKIMEDVECTVEVALCWAVNAKNSLQNIHGFSPYQMVMGKNPILPSSLTNKLPALEGISSSQLVADNLNALHKARQEYIKLESSEKIRRALRTQTRTHNNVRYISGEDVFYKREDDKRWRGPGRVIGQDGSKVLIKIPTGIISVHSCRVMLTSASENQNIDNEAIIESSGIVDENSTNENKIENKENLANAHPNDGINDLNHLNILPIRDELQDSQNEEIPPENIIENGDDNQNLEYQTQNTKNPVPEEILDDSHVLEDINVGQIAPGLPELVEDELEENIEDLEKEVVLLKASDIKNTSDLPKVNEFIKFKVIDSDEWKKCQIISRAGKDSGRYKYWLNIKDMDDFTNTCIDWKNHVSEWSKLEPDIYDIHLVDSNYDEAKQKELENWKRMDVYEEVEDRGQNYVTVKWVLSEKEVDNKPMNKARLVARGFEEFVDRQTDSPTHNKESFRVAVAVISSQNWKINSLDIKAAFLQGKELDRDVYLKPPKEANSKGKLWRLKRCVYGLKEASRFWYFRALDELTALGCKASKYDSCLFTFHLNNCFEGLLVAHVDDFFWAGTENFKNKVIENIKDTFKISTECSNKFKYCGIEIEQNENGIYIDQNKYILTKLEEIKIPHDRRLQKESMLTKDEITELRSAIGKLNWLNRTRPDLSYDVCELATNLKIATVEHLIQANKVIRKAKQNEVRLYFPKLDLNDIKVRVFTDASYGNLPDGGSQGGIYIELCSGYKSCPIDWESKRLRRTPKSTLAAETIAMVEGVESAFLINNLLEEILYNGYAKPQPIQVVTDNFSLFETVKATTACTDKRLRIEMAILRESLARNEFMLKWVTTSNQLADCLTKKSSNPRNLLSRVTGRKYM